MRMEDTSSKSGNERALEFHNFERTVLSTIEGGAIGEHVAALETALLHNAAGSRVVDEKVAPDDTGPDLAGAVLDEFAEDLGADALVPVWLADPIPHLDILLSDKKLIWTYIIGGLFGALIFVLAYNIFPVFEDVKQTSIVMGASASVLAILVAAASYKPDYELNLLLFGRLKFKWLAIIFVVIDLLSISAENPGGHIAHLGGALYGFLYGFLMRKDFDFGKIFRFPKRSGMKYTRYKTVKEEPQRPVPDEQYNQQQAEKEHDVDAILDKIAKNGYASLTQEEKEFLFKSSR